MGRVAELASLDAEAVCAKSMIYSGSFGSCCSDLEDAMKAPPNSMFRIEDTGVLYFTVTLPPTAGFDNQCGYRHAQISRCLG